MIWAVIGYGSIGRRHAENILSMGDEIILVTAQEITDQKSVVRAVEELFLKHKPDAIIISSETFRHIEHYLEIRRLNKNIKILIEKPIFEKPYLDLKDENAFVAYCFRFHDLVLHLRNRIKHKKIICAKFYVGQYLPTWRPERNYQQTYSAISEQGGGVLRDLSHELDLAYFLFGDLNLQYAFLGKVSDLEISSDDLFRGHFSSDQCPTIEIEQNYIDKIHQRYILIHTNEETIRVDFLKSEIVINRDCVSYEINKNKMYMNMLEKFKLENFTSFSTFEDGQKIMKLIDGIERNTRP
ncbi:MAG: Gfo/Idh/MocA family oxidoreductase [Bacteriovoracaceae bacterium]|nr:Gfo/Idh/MocA family oxidoreductase [Bacteriovoracaceae bacterium]